MSSHKKTFLLYLKSLSWLGLIVAFSILCLAAVDKKENDKVQKALVFFKNDRNLGFINQDEVLKEIQNSNFGWQNMKAKNLKLYQMEQNLNRNKYVKSSNIYIDHRNDMCVQIEPKMPILRVNTPYESYYISENWDDMPVSSHFTKRTIQVSGNVSGIMEPHNAVDSFKQYQLRKMYQYIENHEVWSSLIDQIHIDRDGKMKLVLTITDVIVNLGHIKSEEELEKRMEKLRLFIKTVPRYADINKYKEINIQYSHQVIAIKK